MRIVFIQPKAYKHNPAAISEPLNLGYLAAYLRKNGYQNVDIRIGAFEDEESIVADASRADIVGITATSPMMTHGRELANRIKDINPHTKIVFGGSHPTVLPDSTLEDSNIDFVIRGEGEVTMYELTRAIDEGTSLEAIAGLSYRKDGKIIHNPARALIKSLDSIPYPARDLYMKETFVFQSSYEGDRKAACVLSSRGCPFQCTYCASHAVWTRKYRARTPENVMGEIEELIRIYGVRHIYFYDDTFTIQKERTLQFCALLEAQGFDITWGCNVHVNTVDKDMLLAMKRAGCVELWIGVESGSPLILQELKKGSNIQRIEAVFRLSKEIGLKRKAYLMVGAPSESHNTIRETEKFVRKIQPDYVGVTIYTPYPGSSLYNDAKKDGYVSDNIDWSTVDLHFTAVMPTSNLSKDELISEHQRLGKRLPKLIMRSRIFNVPNLLNLIINKLKTSSPKEYPVLVRRFCRYFVEAFSK